MNKRGYLKKYGKRRLREAVLRNQEKAMMEALRKKHDEIINFGNVAKIRE